MKKPYQCAVDGAGDIYNHHGPILQNQAGHFHADEKRHVAPLALESTEDTYQKNEQHEDSDHKGRQVCHDLAQHPENAQQKNDGKRKYLKGKF